MPQWESPTNASMGKAKGEEFDQKRKKKERKEGDILDAFSEEF